MSKEKVDEPAVIYMGPTCGVIYAGECPEADVLLFSAFGEKRRRGRPKKWVNP